MSSEQNRHIVFIKKWQGMPLPAVVEDVKDMGFDGVELPVRDGFWVEPETIASQLPEAAKVFADQGLKMGALAAPADEPTIAAAGDNGIPIVRIMVRIPPDRQYLPYVEETQRHWDTLLSALEKHRVILGVQNHSDRFVTDALGLYHAIGQYDPKLIGAVWDPAHNSLQGDNLDLSLEMIWPWLCMVNVKSAFWRCCSTPDADRTEWQRHWTTCTQGMTDWPAVIADLKGRGYKGDISHSAEYAASDPDNPEHDAQTLRPLSIEDLAYIRKLLAQEDPRPLHRPRPQA